jgi:hypothetical protein
MLGPGADVQAVAAHNVRMAPQRANGLDMLPTMLKARRRRAAQKNVRAVLFLSASVDQPQAER